MMPSDFEGKPLKSLSKGEVDFGLIPLTDQKKDEAKSEEKSETDDATVIAAVTLALGERVADVKASSRLADSPACLVAAGQGPGLEIERLLSRQNRGTGTKPVLELNMKHALVKAVGHAQQAKNESDVNDLSSLLLEQAQILDGELPDDPAAFAARINRIIVRGFDFHRQGDGMTDRVATTNDEKESRPLTKEDLDWLKSRRIPGLSRDRGAGEIVSEHRDGDWK
jgi:molecular chaperone HtpG